MHFEYVGMTVLKTHQYVSVLNIDNAIGYIVECL